MIVCVLAISHPNIIMNDFAIILEKCYYIGIVCPKEIYFMNWVLVTHTHNVLIVLKDWDTSTQNNPVNFNRIFVVVLQMYLYWKNSKENLMINYFPTYLPTPGWEGWDWGKQTIF